MAKAPNVRFPGYEGAWSEETLGNLLRRFRLGGNYTNSETISEYPLIKMGNLDRGSIRIDKLDYISEVEQISDQDRARYGDLFFNTRNTLQLVGKVAIWRNELPVAYYNSNIMLIEFDNNFFMNYRLNSWQGMKALRRIATGTTSVAAIYTKDLLKVRFFVPSWEEQQKIVGFLSVVDEKIAQLVTKKELLLKYKKGAIQQIFDQDIRFKDENGNNFPDWEDIPFRDIARLRKEKFDASTAASRKCVELEHLDQGNGKLLGTIDSTIQKSIKNVFAKGDTLFGKLRPYLKKFWHSSFDGVCSTEIWVMRPSSGYLSSFLFYLIQSSAFLQAVNISSGSKMPRAEWDIVSKYIFSVPTDQKEQSKISDFLSHLDQKIELVNLQLDLTKSFKKGLLQQMFI